jgi:hypothetical protein
MVENGRTRYFNHDKVGNRLETCDTVENALNPRITLRNGEFFPGNATSQQ